MIVGGNTAVVVASETRPLAALELAEAIATSDLPGGVVNLLTGFRAELAPVLAAHMDVNAIDLTGAGDETAELEVLAADNVKRVVRAGSEQSPWEISAFLELKTVWHPVGHLRRCDRRRVSRSRRPPGACVPRAARDPEGARARGCQGGRSGSLLARDVEQSVDRGDGVAQPRSRATPREVHGVPLVATRSR